MKNIMTGVLILLSAFALSGCISKAIEAAIPQKGKREEKVKNVKSVAIVAFDSLLYVPAGLSSHIGAAASLSAAANLNVVESSEAKNLYQALQRTMSDKGFKVINLDQVVSNSIYQRMYNAKKGKIAEKQLSQNQQPHTIKNLLRAANPTYLFTAAEVQELKKALAVDAIVTGRLSYSSSAEAGVFNTGLNSRYLSSAFEFHMFDGNQDSSIWFDLGFLGPRATESIGRVHGHEDTALISKQTVPVGTNAINAFFQ